MSPEEFVKRWQSSTTENDDNGNSPSFLQPSSPLPISIDERLVIIAIARVMPVNPLGVRYADIELSYAWTYHREPPPAWALRKMLPDLVRRGLLHSKVIPWVQEIKVYVRSVEDPKWQTLRPGRPRRRLPVEYGEDGHEFRWRLKDMKPKPHWWLTEAAHDAIRASVAGGIRAVVLSSQRWTQDEPHWTLADYGGEEEYTRRRKPAVRVLQGPRPETLEAVSRVSTKPRWYVRQLEKQQFERERRKVDRMLARLPAGEAAVVAAALDRERRRKELEDREGAD